MTLNVHRAAAFDLQARVERVDRATERSPTMNYSTAKRLLGEHARACGAAAYLQPDEITTTQPIAASGTVTVELELRVHYARRRDHTYFASRMNLYAPELITHPTGASFLEPLAGVPSSARTRLVALRERLNGRVPYAPVPLQAHSDLFNSEACVDPWSEDQLLEHLLLVFTAAQFVADVSLPVSNGIELLAWAKARPWKVRQHEIGSRVMESWRVTDINRQEL